MFALLTPQSFTAPAAQRGHGTLGGNQERFVVGATWQKGRVRLSLQRVAARFESKFRSSFETMPPDMVQSAAQSSAALSVRRSDYLPNSLSCYAGTPGWKVEFDGFYGALGKVRK